MIGNKIFRDRDEAGHELARLLEHDYKNSNPLVLGIPRGGVVVAARVAEALDAALSVIITKKLPHPLQDELAIGACAEDGSVFLTSFARDLDDETVRSIVNAQVKEIESRIRRFRGGKPLPDMKGRIVILVDDGIATGSTIVPAIKLCKARMAAKVVVASPVSGERYVSEINNLADEVVVVTQPVEFYAVGQVYSDFRQLGDAEVIDILRTFHRKGNGQVSHARA